MEAYIDAISHLRNLLAASACLLSPVMQKVAASMWPCLVKDAYVRLLSEQRPLALIIIAHYYILLKNVKDCWYLEHYVRNLFKDVEKRLGKDWGRYIERPCRIVVSEVLDQRAWWLVV
jgi:hypothetical protein